MNGGKYDLEDSACRREVAHRITLGSMVGTWHMRNFMLDNAH